MDRYPSPWCHACFFAMAGEVSIREGEFFDALSKAKGVDNWRPSSPPPPSYEPLRYVIDGRTVNILDGCDCKKFFYWGNCRHYEAAMQAHRTAPERP